jgi:hypothetical protein
MARRACGETAPMQIPKELILKMLMDRGQGNDATQANQELPDQVDPDQHAGLLSKFGLDVGDVMKLVGGGAGGGAAGGAGGALDSIKGKIGL